MIKPYKYCIIGFGISGQILTLELLKSNIASSDIIICDETFVGGDLSTKYGSVLSNTPWWKTKKALEVYRPQIPFMNLPNFPENECTPVREIAGCLLQIAGLSSKGVEKLTTVVNSLEYKDLLWHITHSHSSFQASTVFLTIGGIENNLDISLPKIPLTIAMDKEQLKYIVNSSDTISVFGTSHSGTIVLDNLQSLSTPTYGIYKGSEPFVFETNTYGGLKEHSSTIANSILGNKYSYISLIHWNNPFAIHKALLKSTKIVIATGFKPKHTFGKEYLNYDPKTAALKVGPRIYGFGLAYPGCTTIDNKTYQDNSVLSYQSQIQSCLPDILRT
jgi:hypothetical protein